jgi:hypothetical protein
LLLEKWVNAYFDIKLAAPFTVLGGKNSRENHNSLLAIRLFILSIKRVLSLTFKLVEQLILLWNGFLCEFFCVKSTLKLCFSWLMKIWSVLWKLFTFVLNVWWSTWLILIFFSELIGLINNLNLNFRKCEIWLKNIWNSRIFIKKSCYLANKKIIQNLL